MRYVLDTLGWLVRFAAELGARCVTFPSVPTSIE
jgi:hypothetical protein